MEESIKNKFKEKSVERLIKSLTDEKLQAQQRRSTFNIRKLIFVGGLFSLGTVKFQDQLELSFVLYIVPFMSICFDLYILGEDYGIKRIGGFLRNQFKNEPESTWENWVGLRRDPFATFAIPFLTLIVLISSSAVIWETAPHKVLFVIWLLVNILATIFIFVYSQHLRKSLLINE